VKNRNLLFILLFLGITVFIVYFDALGYPFLSWDDTAYIIDNPLFTGNFFHTVKNIFSTCYFGNYFPLQLLSYAVEIWLFGHNPFFFHLDNILLHFFNAVLVFYLFFYLGGKSRQAFICAVLFAVHPAHCESVAWVSERKDTLFLFFMMISFILFLRFWDIKRKLYLIISLVFFVFSTLSKSTSVVMPFLIFITLIQFRKYTISKSGLITLAPYLFVSLVICAIQLLAGRYYGVWGEKITFIHGAGIFLKYICNLLFPINLSPRYGILEYFPAGLVFTAIFALIYFCIKNNLLRWSVLWFLAGLLPVLNIVPIQIKMADRYLYMPALSLYFLFSITADKLMISKKKPVLICLALLFTCLIVRTVVYAKTFSNTKSLWSRAATADRNDARALLNLAVINYNSTGNFEDVVPLLKTAYAIAPNDPDVLVKTGKLYFQEGNLSESESFFKEALLIPKTLNDFPETIFLLLQIYILKGDFENEQKTLDVINSKKPNKTTFNSINLSFSMRVKLYQTISTKIESANINSQLIESIMNLYALGNIAGVKSLIEKALRYNPDNPDLNFVYAFGLLLENDETHAKHYFGKSLNSANDFFSFFASAMTELANNRQLIKKLENGLGTFGEKPELYLELAIYYAKSGKFMQAKQMFDNVIKSNPAWEYVPRSVYVQKLIKFYIYPLSKQ